MLKILSITKKNVLMRFSSGATIIFFFVLPALFTFALGGGFGSDDETNTGPLLVVVNQDQSNLAENLLEIINNTNTVQLSEKSLIEAEAIFEAGDVPALLIIPTGFETTLLAAQPIELTLRKLPNNNDALAIERVLQTSITQVSQVLNVAANSVTEAEGRKAFETDEARQAYFNQSVKVAQAKFSTIPQRINITTPSTTLTTDLDETAQQSAGQLVTWVFISLVGASGLFVIEREMGTLRRLLSTPTQRATFMLGSISGELGLGLIQMLLLIGFGVIVMGVNWGRSPLGLATMMLSFGLASVALGTMLATFVKTTMQANNLALLIGMAMALLGGCWFPLELFPETVRTAVKVLPTTWAMQGFSDLIIRGLGVNDILLEASVLCGFAIVFFIIGVYRFKFE